MRERVIWRIKKEVSGTTANVWRWIWQWDRPRTGEVVIVNDEVREIISVQKLGRNWFKVWYSITWEGNRDEPDPIDDEEDEFLESVA